MSQVQNAGVRTVGVEEELLLVDAITGEVRSSADAVLGSNSNTRLTGELQQEQVETGTRPTSELDDLYSDILRLRRRADEAAERHGARVVALGTSPLPVSPQVTPHPRYLKMVERFALTAAEQLTCRRPAGNGDPGNPPRRCRRRSCEELLRSLLARGNGALAQRAIFTRTQDLRAVVLDAVRDGSGRDRSTGSVLGAHRDPAEPASARQS